MGAENDPFFKDPDGICLRGDKRCAVSPKYRTLYLHKVGSNTVSDINLKRGKREINHLSVNRQLCQICPYNKFVEK